MKFFKNTLSFVLSAVLVLCLSNSAFALQYTEDSNLYYKNQLLNFENGSNLIKGYEALSNAVKQMEDSVEFSISYKLSPEDLSNIINVFLWDNPWAFYFDYNFSYSYMISNNQEIVLQADLTYTMSKSEVEEAKEEIDSVVNNIMMVVDKFDNDYDKERYIHDYLALSINYIENDHAYDIYGALVLHESVCEGYAKAFQYLLAFAGIKSCMVAGQSYNPSTKLLEEHAWNLVLIDDVYTYVDVTWDDQGEAGIWYTYFNLPYSLISVDHQFYGLSFEFPTDYDLSQNYFYKKQAVVNELSVNSIVSLFKNDRAVFLYLGNESDVYSWYQNNISNIVAGIHVNGGYSYGYVEFGYAKIMYINWNNTATKTVSGTVSSNSARALYLYPENIDDEIIKLDAISDTPVLKLDYEAEYSSKNFSFKNVYPGTYKAVYSYNGEVDIVSLKVENFDVTNVFLGTAAGDINADGAVDDKDVSTLRKYLAGWDVYCNKEHADVNKDGNIDDKDSSHLAKYLAGWTGIEI